MTKVVQKWVLERYSTLWKRFENKEFTFKEAEMTLKERNLKRLSKILEELRRAEWLTISLDSKDTRKSMRNI